MQTNNNIAISMNVFHRRGGIEHYAFDLIRLFAQSGLRVTVYASKFDTSLPEYELINPIIVNLKHIPKKLRAFWFTRQLNKIRKPNEKLISCNLCDNADVLICGGNHLGYLHSLNKKGNIFDRLLVYRNYTNYRSAKSIMAHSQLMKDELDKFYHIDVNKITTLYPPIDVEHFQSHSQPIENIREKYQLSENEVIFLFPSTGHKRKGLKFLAQYFEKTHLPVKLLVVGAPLPKPMKNVIEYGFCQNMAAMYKSVDYTILASIYEPFGLIGVESILSGTKVVLADNIACCEVMNEQAGFFFTNQLMDSLATAIEKAVLLKQTNQHRITNPLSALTYSPFLEQHFMGLRRLLAIES